MAKHCALVTFLLKRGELFLTPKPRQVLLICLIHRPWQNGDPGAPKAA